MTDYAQPIPLDVTPEALGYPAEPATPSRRRLPELSRPAMAALAVVAVATGVLTYGLVRTTTDLHRTQHTLAATRTTLDATQTQLGQTKTDLATTRKDLDAARASLADTKSELDDVQSQLDTAKSQLSDARADASKQRSRGDAAVRAALDVRQCLDNIAANSAALMEGDYTAVTWDDAMKAQCDQALAETGELAAPAESGDDTGTSV